MVTIVLRVDPRCLANPDLDIRYTLPDLIAQKSGNTVKDNGYDYDQSNALLLYMIAEDRETATRCVLEVVGHDKILGNDLRHAVTVAIEENGQYSLIYPTNPKGVSLP